MGQIRRRILYEQYIEGMATMQLAQIVFKDNIQILWVHAHDADGERRTAKMLKDVLMKGDSVG